MKSILRPEDRAELMARLDALQPDTPRRWGRMTVGGMVCHLNDAFLMVLGERDSDRSPRFVERTLLRWVALSTPVPWPKGVPTTPECDQEQKGTPPGEFERDRQAVRDSATRFVDLVPRGQLIHPAFGALSKAEWGRWGYRHMDHHLRQFGV